MVKRHEDAAPSASPSPDPRVDRRLHGFDYATLKGSCRKRKRLDRLKALREMLAPSRRCSGNGAVSPGSYENGDRLQEFLSTGRAGRRNALPEFIGRHTQPGLVDLAERFKELSTDTDQPSGSGSQDPNAPGTSKQHG